MIDIPLVLAIAWIAQGVLLYCAYGPPGRSAPDGAPRNYVAADRPDSIRNLTRVFRRFTQAASLLLVAGGAMLLVVLAR